MLSIDLQFARGEFLLTANGQFSTGVTGICGASGSGKSTLLALLAGLLRPQVGRLRFGNTALVDTTTNQFTPAWRRHFALVFQDGLLEIGPLQARRPVQLSGGERQRVALGRALLYSPRLLLLDEPLSSLDDRLKQQILPFLKRIKEETSIPMIYVTHARAEVDFLADRVLFMEAGRLVA